MPTKIDPTKEYLPNAKKYRTRLIGRDGFDSVVLEQDAIEAVIRAAQIYFPLIVCLCGSTRFYDAFQQANYDETMAGRIVLSVGFFPHAKAVAGHGEGVGHDSAEKVALDELHKRKIDLCDEVYVLNVGGYIGSSTRSEMEYAVAHGKPIRYLEHDTECDSCQVSSYGHAYDCPEAQE